MAHEEIIASEQSHEPVAAWWERNHVEGSQSWLTGSTSDTVWTRLGLADKLGPDHVVLNIGVGLGADTRALAERVKEVHVLDIAPSALARVQDVTKGGYLASDLDALPTAKFDYALSHLVAQHMDDEALLAQMRAVFRALKPGGVFAVQSACVTSAFDRREDALHMKGGGVLRTEAMVETMVKATGGSVVASFVSDELPHDVYFFTTHAMPAAS